MNRLLSATAILGFVIVSLGAFGAHTLDAVLSAQAKGWWETATFYALVHNVAALAIALTTNKIKAAGWAFIIGSVVFSGSLYAMALGARSWFGAITPIGGVCFLTGWVLIFMFALKQKP